MKIKLIRHAIEIYKLITTLNLPILKQKSIITCQTFRLCYFRKKKKRQKIQLNKYAIEIHKYISMLNLPILKQMSIVKLDFSTKFFQKKKEREREI